MVRYRHKAKRRQHVGVYVNSVTTTVFKDPYKPGSPLNYDFLSLPFNSRLTSE